MSRFRSLMSSAFMVVLAGCSVVPLSADVSKLQPPYRVEVNSSRGPGDWNVSERTLTAGSPEEQAVTRWLQAHSTGWHPDFTSYVPSRRIRGDGFDLNFVGNLCVLNYHVGPDDRWSQMSRTVPAKDGIPGVFPPDDNRDVPSDWSLGALGTGVSKTRL